MGVRQGILSGIGGSARVARLALLVLAALMASLVLPAARAGASTTEQSILMDDNQLIYASPGHVASAMAQMLELGVDRIKVSVVWSLVAPGSDSGQKPHFDATNPNAYPRNAWQRYDVVDELAHQLGLGVYFQLTAPAPDWAVQPGAAGLAREHSWSHEPDPQEFQQFAEAVGRRYSGSFVPPVPPPAPLLTLPLGITVANPGATSQPGAPLPAVTWWGIWNEPNYPGWLSPQRRSLGGRSYAYSPLLERQLTDAAYAGLTASGHSADTILIGETASGGTITPVPFLRDLYCLGPRYRPLRGQVAVALGCPTGGPRSAFVAAHPALFRAAGYAHHPYSFDQPPGLPYRSSPGIITLANLGRLERALDSSLRAYHQRPGMPFYLTEWGYKTNPPNPFVHTSLQQQASWLNEGEYMTWRNPRVRALAQYLLYDDLPRNGAVPGTLSYWSTFQSGLYFHNGQAKPSLDAFRLPIWLPHAHTGRRVALWAQLRPAHHATLQTATIQFRPSAHAPWSSLSGVETTSAEGFVYTYLAIPHRGMIRLAWDDTATGAVYYSRTVGIS